MNKTIFEDYSEKTGMKFVDPANMQALKELVGAVTERMSNSMCRLSFKYSNCRVEIRYTEVSIHKTRGLVYSNSEEPQLLKLDADRRPWSAVGAGCRSDSFIKEINELVSML